MLDHFEISLSARIRKNIEKTLVADETATYTFVEPQCPFEAKNNNAEQGDRNTSIMIQSVSIVLTGSPRNDLPLEYTRKFVIMNADREMHRGIVRYQRASVFLVSSKKSKEPKREIMLNNSMMVMKSKSDAIKSGVIIDMERNMTDTKPVTHVIIKTTDVNASAIFILIKSSP